MNQEALMLDDELSQKIIYEYNLLTPLRNQGRFDVPAALIIYAYQLIPCFASN
jgi:hypothetical protein